MDYCLLLLFLVSVNAIGINNNAGRSSFRYIDNLDELNALEEDAYAHNKQNNPDRLLKFSQLRAKSDKMISDFRANIDGIVFSGVFSNGAVLHPAPQFSSSM